MKQPSIPSADLRLVRSTIGSIGGKAGSRKAKVTAGKAGARKRWAHILRCAECGRPATKAQKLAAKQHGAQEVKVL